MSTPATPAPTILDAAPLDADAFYPGFEHAGLETPIERALTTVMCYAASAFVAIVNAGGAGADTSAPDPARPAFEA